MSKNQFDSAEYEPKGDSACYVPIRFIETLSPVEKLPRHVLFNIFDHVPELALTLKLTSWTFKECIDAFAQQRATFSSIEEIALTVTSGSINCTISVPNEVSKLLELRLKVRQSAKLSPYALLQRSSDPLGYRDLTHYTCSSIGGEGVLEYLNQSIGVSAKRVELRFGDMPISDTAVKLLRRIRVENLSLDVDTLGVASSERLLALIKDNRVDHLTLKVKSVTVSDPVKILQGLASSLRFIRIDDSSFADFFGFTNGLATTVITMFEGRLDKLSIKSSQFAEDMSLEETELLRDRITTMARRLGKKIWLELPCKHFLFGVQYNRVEIKQHYVTTSGRLLCIKHLERVNEY